MTVEYTFIGYHATFQTLSVSIDSFLCLDMLYSGLTSDVQNVTLNKAPAHDDYFLCHVLRTARVCAYCMMVMDNATHFSALNVIYLYSWQQQSK